MTEQTQKPVEPTTTSTPGQLLKEARERKGLSLSDIAAKLHLSTQWIKDIEADNYRHINALVYIQGHLRSYAKHVGVAEGTIMKALKALELPLPDSMERPLSSASLPIYDKDSKAKRHLLRWISLGVMVLLVAMVAIWWCEQASHHQAVSLSSSLLNNQTENSQTPSPMVSESMPKSLPASDTASNKTKRAHHRHSQRDERYHTHRVIPDDRRS